MIQLGISAFYHDSAACIVKEGKVVSACQEERWSKVKHDASFPHKSINWVLAESGITIDQIDEICWYEDPELKKERVLKTFAKRWWKTYFLKRKFLKEFEENNPKNILKDTYNYTGKINYINHHHSHAALAYFTSKYEEATVVTVDGVGEWNTASVYKGEGEGLREVMTINFPNSIGLLYSTITSYLGFRPNDGEYKVMGLAPYGDADMYFDKLFSVFNNTTNKFFIDQKYFTWEYSDKVMFNKKLCRLLGVPPRLPEEEITQEHKDLAAALQKVYEKVFLKFVNRAQKMTQTKNLCLGGGCAYNGVANNYAYKYYDSIHIPYAPSDAGSAIGACLASYRGIRKDNTSPFLGPSFSNDQIRTILYSFRDKLKFVELTELKLKKAVVTEILLKKVVGWFRGKMEFGDRALGNRSILASAFDPDMRDRLNTVTKKRESFRPFAPVVLADHASKNFHVREDVPYMSQVVPSKAKTFPAATHIDGTARVQTLQKDFNPSLYSLIQEIFNQSGRPVVLNTSFNLKDETIVMTPVDAISTFLRCDMDCLVLENFLVTKI